VADEGGTGSRKMDFDLAKDLISDLARAGVDGISFSAGEPFLYIDDIAALVKICTRLGIYTRVVTNGFWAGTSAAADVAVSALTAVGLCQLRLSFSRWHQEYVNRQNVLNAAESCRKAGLDYFISFVTDFSEGDDSCEQYLRDHGLRFFPEPMMYSGRAAGFPRRAISTDYQENRCSMNPYISPDFDMYACCDAGSQFSETDFFYLGSLRDQPVDRLFRKSETDRLYNLIRNMGVTTIASYAGMKAREIITYSKCDLCRILFNDSESLARLRENVVHLEGWRR
jgi:MoaA/NifB/PqqE/SkfB family radical SAM enzyme